MQISSYNPHDRYRRKAADRMAGVMTVVFMVALSLGIGFWFGNQNAGQEARILKKQMNEASDLRLKMQDEITALRAEAQTANARYKQVQDTYKETIPEGPMQELVLLLKKQIDEGRSAERLAFLIRSARPPRNCSEPQSRRFVVSTPAYKGPESKLILADGALSIKATGKSATNAKGQPEAWFDPAKKVAISFTNTEGETETKTGILPLQHSVVVGNKEYRLNITDGARSFAKVSYDSCDYP
ncbi:MAG: hypothetical protein KDI46_02955 [Alphaproteobacteria bacterium]|nr:hypothetical protein [Alphaproteobacteria bacterium]